MDDATVSSRQQLHSPETPGGPVDAMSIHGRLYYRFTT